jgi:2-oxoglutarate dehydrogenase E2 component (dihydrolipoamide succinyltransferase)
MIIEIKIPSPGESISEAEIAAWLVEEGDHVEKDQEIAEIESEKATLPLIAEQGGKVFDLAPAGESLNIGDVACRIDTEKEGRKETPSEKPVEKEETTVKTESEPTGADQEGSAKTAPTESREIKVTPVAGKMMQELGLDVNDIINGLQRITKKEVGLAAEGLKDGTAMATSSGKKPGRETETIKMSQLRKKLSARLVAAKNETAMLTTFNEVDMSEIIRLRKTYQNQFVERHNIKLGFMSFFTKAVTIALQSFPQVNSMIDGENFVQFKYSDIGIAVQTDKGLMVPVIRNTEALSLADIEKRILELAEKARINRISIEDLSGGTFTITNGGVFGSMLSTPILNPPQAAILGMHNIVERPVAIRGKVEIRPVMYLALSYDHRIIDGRDSVGFLVAVKKLIESPVDMLFQGKNTDALLLDL